MRSFANPWGNAVCGVDGGPITGPLVPASPLNACSNEAAFQAVLRDVGTLELNVAEEDRKAGFERFLALPPHAIVFTHGDLNRHNIMVGPDGHISGVIDWEAAAWLPDFWEVSVTAFLGQTWGQFLNREVTREVYEKEIAGHRHLFAVTSNSLAW